MAMDVRLATLLHVEERLVCYDQQPPAVDQAIALLPGSLPILISAPHSTLHWRDPAWKQEEEYTAALGYLLHRTTNATLIYGRYMLNPDPHDDGDTGTYKRTLDEVFDKTKIRLVVDLHGARGDRDFAVAIGTMRGVSFGAYE